MSARSRRARRRLTAHDRGENRHNKGLSWMLKRNRQAYERNRIAQVGRRSSTEERA